MTADLLAGVLAGLAVALPIGAIGSYLVGLAATERFAVAAAAALGVATTDGLYAVVAGLGIGGVERVVGTLAAPLRWLAAALLVGLAVRTMVTAVRRARPGTLVSSGTERAGLGAAILRPSPGRQSQRHIGVGSSSGTGFRALRTYAMLLGLTAVNPATIATFAAIVVGHQLEGSPGWLAAMVFGSGAFVASGVWQLTLVSAGSLLGHLLAGPRGQLGVASASAALMLTLAMLTLLS